MLPQGKPVTWPACHAADVPPLPAQEGSVFPSIRYAGRRASDPRGSLQGEWPIQSGAFSQIGTARWGDYSSMSVDPVDDCTFWYTNQYVADGVDTSFGRGQWATRIAAFRFPSCGCGAFSAPLLNVPGMAYAGTVPSDSVGDAGTCEYVQAVNSSDGALFQVFDKHSGASLTSPRKMAELAPKESPCGQGLGDPIVLWDNIARRWFLAQVGGDGGHLCIYLSLGESAAAGEFTTFSVPSQGFPDFAKYGVFVPESGESAYLATSNEEAPALYVIEREAMLEGRAPRVDRFSVPALGAFAFQALTPADLDGTTPAPAGAPALFVRQRDDEIDTPTASDPTRDYLDVWGVDVDFAAGSRLRPPRAIAVTDFDSRFCGLNDIRCLGQPGTATRLDPFGEVVAWRFSYRNFGSYAALLGEFSVSLRGNATAGLRWFELRTGVKEELSLYQEGTWSPDGASRFMGSIAMDRAGNIALGYSVTKGDAKVADPLEPNDRPAQAADVACGFQTTNAAIEPLGDVDYYRITGPVGQTLSVDIDAAEDGSSLDSIVGVFDSALHPLKINDQGAAPGERITTDSFVEVTIPADGVLFVAVSAYSDFDFVGSQANSQGSYRLSLGCSPPRAADPNEPNDDSAHATRFECPGSIAAAIDATSDRDYYRLEQLAAGSRVAFDLDAGTPGLDTLLFVLDSSGALIAFNDDGAAPGESPSKESFAELTVPSDGVVTLLVVARSVGSYTLSCN